MPTFIAGHALDSVDLTPLPGATITEVSNPSNTSAADNDGSFAITVNDPSAQLIISYPGYVSLQDTANNLQGDDWLQSNTKAYAWMYQQVRQTASSLPGIAITAIVIIIIFKLLKIS